MPGAGKCRLRRQGGYKALENPMRKLQFHISMALLFLTGLSILLYPELSSRWNARREAQLISEYRREFSDADSSEKEKIETALAAAEAYNQSLQEPEVPDAFSVRDGIRDSDYEALLDLQSDDIMGTVEIPAIAVELPIYHYTTKEVLEHGAGHLFGSALPVGGQNTHCVISAHRGLPSAKMFTDLPLLETGDSFYFHVLGETFAYEVDQILTVEPTEVESLSVTQGQDYATLVTCTPYGVNTHRILVRGHRVPYAEEVYQEEASHAPKTDIVYLRTQLLCAALGFLIALLVLAFVVLRDKRKKERRQRDIYGNDTENDRQG